MPVDKRDDLGRFALGNSGGPGRPPIEHERKYIDTLRSACTVEDWQAICKRAVRDARGGDDKARNWLSKYLLGEPRPLAQVLHAHAHVHAETQESPFAGATPDQLIEAG